MYLFTHTVFIFRSYNSTVTDHFSKHSFINHPHHLKQSTHRSAKNISDTFNLININKAKICIIEYNNETILFHVSATYFNAIMFMVAASVVTTILILNYHHRKTETHEMPQWVSVQYSTVQ